MAATTTDDQADDDDAWLDHAACAAPHITSRLFWAPGPASAEDQAIWVCVHQCPVQLECLVWAMATEPPDNRFNILGGTRPFDRKALARQLVDVNDAHVDHIAQWLDRVNQAR